MDTNQAETTAEYAAPTSEMLEIPERIATYMSTRDPQILEGVFSPNGVTILENFPPHIFNGVGAGKRWAEGFASYAEDLNIEHAFGEPQNFSVNNDIAFFTLPTNWTGTVDDRVFSENGGWLFILELVDERWMLKGYGWAVVDFQYLD